MKTIKEKEKIIEDGFASIMVYLRWQKNLPINSKVTKILEFTRRKFLKEVAENLLEEYATPKTPKYFGKIWEQRIINIRNKYLREIG
jgi:hypothetical protein